MNNTVDLITLNDNRSALFVNRQRFKASSDTEQMTTLAHAVSESLSTDKSFNHYQCSANDVMTWDMAEKSVYKAIDNGSIQNQNKVDAPDDALELNDDAIDNELEGLAKGMKSAFRRSLQRMANYDSDTMGKYFNSAVTMIGGTMAMYGALEGNPLLAEYLTEIGVTTAAAAGMSLYGASLAVAATANQSLIQKYPGYQDKVNEHLMNKLDKELRREGVTTPDDLTPKQKAEFSELVKVHYGTEHGVELTTALFEMHKLERSPEKAADNTQSISDRHEPVESPGVGFGR